MENFKRSPNIDIQRISLQQNEKAENTEILMQVLKTVDSNVERSQIAFAEELWTKLLKLTNLIIVEIRYYVQKLKIMQKKKLAEVKNFSNVGSW